MAAPPAFTEGDWIQVLSLYKEGKEVADIVKKLCLKKPHVVQAINTGWKIGSRFFPNGKDPIAEILKREELRERGEAADFVKELEEQVDGEQGTVARYESMLAAIESTLGDVMDSKKKGGVGIIMSRDACHNALQRMPLAGLLVAKLIDDIATRLKTGTDKYSIKELIEYGRDIMRLMKDAVLISGEVDAMEARYLGDDQAVVEILRRIVKKTEMSPEAAAKTLEGLTLVKRLGPVPAAQYDETQAPLDVEFTPLLDEDRDEDEPKEDEEELEEVTLDFSEAEAEEEED